MKPSLCPKKFIGIKKNIASSKFNNLMIFNISRIQLYKLYICFMKKSLELKHWDGFHFKDFIVVFRNFNSLTES